MHKYERDKNLSYIGAYAKDNYKYASQYKTAFDILYKSDEAIDGKVMPMMYVLRHYLELILKYNIEYFSEFSDSEFMLSKIKSEHKLIPLAKGFYQHWTIVAKRYTLKIDSSSYFEKLDKLINIINKLDKNSISFRYSHDKTEKNSFDELKQLDGYYIKNLFDEVMPLLQYSIDVFESHIEKEKNNSNFKV